MVQNVPQKLKMFPKQRLRCLQLLETLLQRCWCITTSDNGDDVDRGDACDGGDGGCEILFEFHKVKIESIPMYGVEYSTW